MKEKDINVTFAIFQWKKDLKKHTSSVHEGKIFRCELCESSFTQKRNLSFALTFADSFLNPQQDFAPN